MQVKFRDTWEFAYTLEEVLVAAEAKLSHHDERLSHWKDELARRQRRLAEVGIEFRPAGRKGWNERSEYYGKKALYPDLLNDFNEAQERVDHHNSLREAFSRWVSALMHARFRNHSLTKDLDLSIDDVAFFGL